MQLSSSVSNYNTNKYYFVIIVIIRQPSPAQIVTEEKHLENIKNYSYLGSMIKKKIGVQIVHVKLKQVLPQQRSIKQGECYFHQ
jgi:hypothetical protein